MAHPIDISLVVPIFNEVDSVGILQNEIEQALDSMDVEWEVIYVDDCSTDGSLEALKSLLKPSVRIRILKFRRNYGQTAAMAAGFDASRGSIVITLDGGPWTAFASKDRTRPCSAFWGLESLLRRTTIRESSTSAVMPRGRAWLRAPLGP